MKSRSGFPGKLSFFPGDANHQRFESQFFHPLFGSCFTFESNETIKDVMLKSGLDSMRVYPLFNESFPENPFTPLTTTTSTTTTTTTTTEPTTTTETTQEISGPDQGSEFTLTGT